MGNDGGSIPKRRELVKEAAKAVTAARIKETQTEQQEYGWSTDPLTRKPLAPPIVSDAAGILYNKDSIIEYLLKDDDDVVKAEMRKMGGGVGAAAAVAGSESAVAELGTLGDRVKGLKDVVEVKFVSAEEEEEEEEESEQQKKKKDEHEERDRMSTTRREDLHRAKDGKSVWLCPITGTVLGPNAKAIYIVPCGHVFAGSVVKEVAGSACLLCNEPYAENDIIPILPTQPADIARLSLRIKTLRDKRLTHALKKASGGKKRKKAGKEATGHMSIPVSVPESESETASQPQLSSSAARPSAPAPPPPTTDWLKNASTASLTRKVLEEQQALNKRRKLTQNQNVNSLFHRSETTPKLENSADYMTRGFSIARK